MWNRRPVWNWLVLVFVCTAIAPKASTQGTSTPEERMQWAEVTHKLESNPLDADVNKDGEKALHRVMEVHDFHVPLCPAFLSEFSGMKYPYSHSITRQFMLATAAFLIENPGKTNDRNAMNLAAVESVLKTYGSILQQKPDAKAKVLDDLVHKQKQGSLAEYVQKKCP